MSCSKIKILTPFEYCTHHYLQGVLPALERLGIQGVVVHREVSALQNNFMYIFCMFTPEPDMSKKMQVKRVYVPVSITPTDNVGPWTLPGGMTGWSHRLMGDGDQLLGYYSKTKNIYWLADVTHTKEGADIIEIILDTLQLEEKKIGRKIGHK